jgi:Uma2 family endonuclease
MRSIIEPQTKPATEWIGGRAVQKVSPTGRHANAQGRIVAAFLAWADACGAGRVGTEWEFRIAPPGEVVRSLVPDVAFLSYERLGFEQDQAAQMPSVPPNAAVEILSPNDRWRNVNEKIRVYLACGTGLVAIADPEGKTVMLHDASGVVTLKIGDTLHHPELPGFAMPVADIFAKSGQR